MCLPHRSPPPSFCECIHHSPSSHLPACPDWVRGDTPPHVPPLPVCSGFFITAALSSAGGVSVCRTRPMTSDPEKRSLGKPQDFQHRLKKEFRSRTTVDSVMRTRDLTLHQASKRSISCLLKSSAYHIWLFSPMLLPKHRCVFPLEGKFPPSKAALAMLAHEYGSGQRSYESIYLIYILVRDDAT